MRRRHLPRIWLFTDERLGEGLWTAVARLPRGGGVVVRHYSLPRAERLALARRVMAAARRRGLTVIIGGEPLPVRADGVHGLRTPRNGASPLTMPAHNPAELVAARRAGASLVFLSPVFATRSHPGARTLGRVRFGLFARNAGIPIVALGGMNARRARTVPGAYGWAGIDAFN